jgi:hypothetical protein
MIRSADDKRARFLEAQQHSPDVPASTTLGATDRQSGAAEVGTCRHKPGVVGFDLRLPSLGRQPDGEGFEPDLKVTGIRAAPLRHPVFTPGQHTQPTVSTIHE